MKLFTIGFTKKSAEEFFSALFAAGVERVLDVRLRRDSQLAGFAKERDLRYFLQTIAGIGYIALPELAPTAELLDAYRKRQTKWAGYEQEFTRLLQERAVEKSLDKKSFAQGCLLCSEATADHCHRRLVAEYLASRWGDVEIQHL